MSNETLTKETLAVFDGYLCEAGCIDMGLKRGDPRRQGLVIEIPDGQVDLEMRGLGQNTVREIAKHLRQRLRVTIEVVGSGDENE